MFDPVIVHASQASLSMILMVGGIQKLLNLAAFESAVSGYRLLPENLIKVVVWLIPVLEITAASLLLVNQYREIGAFVASLLLSLVTFAVVTNLARGNVDIECGCGGLTEKMHLSWALPIRNCVLLILALGSSLAFSSRELYLLDQLSILFASICFFILYTTVNQLIANQPLLSSAKRNS